ncbi:reverse transcriptase/maturase family protein [Streptomyces celluloflavus]|uniref:reverse transcriptase/maturase family protein n=1 Tax=Streptomyces celluloflavus TaxID=58344 RepID=UPI0036C06707
MQSAETVLEIIRKRGKEGLPIERLYRQLFNPQLYLMAYGRIYANSGAMTPGATGETVDGMSLDKINGIIEALRGERYRWSPVKRAYIEKKGSAKKRPLGLPSWSDKLVAEVVRLLLDAYYEPQFSDRSHGFRPGRGCHTALTEVANTWAGVHWFIEGDIADCFGSLDHEVLTSILAERIHDARFVRLIRQMLKAGYLEDWRWNATLSGAPQGGVASPVLSNIYLDRLDQFIERVLTPEYNKGKLRRWNPAYSVVCRAIKRAQRLGDKKLEQKLKLSRRSMPSRDPHDPNYRRLRYVRYADDWLLGFAGPKHEAEEIKSKVQQFLARELALELSGPKTLITHAASQAARFLGYEVRVQHSENRLDKKGRRSVNGAVGLYVPREVIRQKCSLYMREGKPARRPLLRFDTDFSVVARYQSEYRGFVQYYLLAQDVFRLSRLGWVMETSLLKTLAGKHKSTVTKMARRYAATVETPEGPRKCFQVVVPREERKPLVARFGGIPLKRKKSAVLVDRNPVYGHGQRNELVRRLLADRCEICESRTQIEVHHVRKLADLKKPGRKEKPLWVFLMASRNRKTLVVCRSCHEAIHAGRGTATLRKRSLESDVR